MKTDKEKKGRDNQWQKQAKSVSSRRIHAELGYNIPSSRPLIPSYMTRLYVKYYKFQISCEI